MNNTGEQFGEMVNRLRKERGESLEALGNRSGVSASYLFRIEKMKREATVETKLQILNKGFGMSGEELKTVLNTHTNQLITRMEEA